MELTYEDMKSFMERYFETYSSYVNSTESISAVGSTLYRRFHLSRIHALSRYARSIRRDYRGRRRQVT